MSKKIVGIAAGEAHTLALAGDGSVFSWGRGNFGRLGTGKEEDELTPVPVSFGDGEGGQTKFVGVATGAYHSLALQDDGSVWSWGFNIYGQLGHGGEENTSRPCLVERFQELLAPESLSEESDPKDDKKPLKICSIKAGGMMSVAIDSLGSLWIWGNCPQLSKTEDGESFCLVSSPPLSVWDFHGHTVVKVACGNEHIVAVVSSRETYTGRNLVCYSWGNNSHGQLGLGDKENRAHPAVIPVFSKDSPWTICEIACGAFHTAILTRIESYDQETDSKCWTFGLGENGQLGHGTTISLSLPEPVDALPSDAILISVDCGLFHTSIVSSEGEVWSWGMERGLGLCPNASFSGNDAGDALSPLRITSPEIIGGKFPCPVQIACGAAHTVLVAEDGGKLWAWGRGQSGVLGRGQAVDSLVPCLVMWPPLGSDFEEEEEEERRDKATGSGSDVGPAVEMEEVRHLREKLALMERYATLLHVSVFRKPFDQRNLPKSLQDSGAFDIWRELESVMDSAATDELARLEMFYKSMLSNVKDKLMRRRIQEMVKESLVSLSKGRQTH